MKEPSNNNSNLCLYFQSKEEAERNYYVVIAQGMLQENQLRDGFKGSMKEVGVQLRVNVVDTVIDRLNLKKEEDLERERIEQEKREREEGLRVQREREREGEAEIERERERDRQKEREREMERERE